MSEVAHEGERPADLTMALETLMRFGTLMLRAGDTAFRVRDWMSMIARGMGLDALSVNIALGGMTVTARRGGEHATLVSEIAPPGVNAWRPRTPGAQHPTRHEAATCWRWLPPLRAAASASGCDRCWSASGSTSTLSPRCVPWLRPASTA